MELDEPRILTFTAATANLDRGVVIRDGKETRLTANERGLLAYLADRPNLVIGKGELLKEVWGYHPGVRTRAVDHAVARLRKKLEIDASAPEHLVTVHGVGFRLDVEDAARQVLARARKPGNSPPIPIIPGAFIGRSEELETIRTHVAAGARLITLVGPGGAGKTRTALRFLNSLSAPPYFCDLADARDAADVCSVASAGTGVGVVASGDVDVDVVAIADAWSALEGSVVVLDNFEQVSDAAAKTVSEWTSTKHGPHLIVTSRAPLRLAGEHVVDIGPLPVPISSETDPEAVAVVPSVRLFTERASSAGPELRVDRANVADVVALVRALDGLPLALELAAARTRILSVAQIRDRLADRFSLLKTDRRDRDTRHATLEAAIAWSWDLLPDYSRSALVQCAVFVRGFTLGSAERVIDLTEWPDAPDPMDAISELREASLVRQADSDPDTDRRWGLYNSVRAFALAKARSDTEKVWLNQASARHAEYFSRPVPLPPGELGNLLAAVDWAITNKRGDLAGPACIGATRLLKQHGPLAAAEALTTRVLRLELEPHRRSMALRCHSAVLRRRGRPHEAAGFAGEALKILPEDTPIRTRVLAFMELGVARRQG